MNTFTITGPRPYCPKTTGSMEVLVLPELIGREVSLPDSSAARDEAAPQSRGEAWARIAGPYVLPGESEMLLGLLWDMAGEPIAPGGPRRPRANWCLVSGPEWGGKAAVSVYRDATELVRIANADDAAQEEASRLRGALPDGRSGLRKGVAA